MKINISGISAAMATVNENISKIERKTRSTATVDIPATKPPEITFNPVLTTTKCSSGQSVRSMPPNTKAFTIKSWTSGGLLIVADSAGREFSMSLEFYKEITGEEVKR